MQQLDVWTNGSQIVPAMDQPVRIYADLDILYRVARNLIWNALKYATRSTTIEFGVTLHTTNREIVFFVRNHCLPIGTDRQRQIFEAFGAVGGVAAVQGFHSIGLGLAFCKLAAEAHGGTIRLESPCTLYGDGAEFSNHSALARREQLICNANREGS